jgi:4-amino-4-deoxy-L-arabinose transferase-like glycosyltransferase
VILLLSILIYVYTSLVVGRWVFQKLTPGKYLVVLFLTIYSLNVLAVGSLAILHRLNDRPFFLLTQIILCLTVLSVLHLAAGVSLKPTIKLEKPAWGAGEYAIISCLLFIMGGFFLVGISTSPNNLDSLATHLLRIYYWLQHGSLESWPASTPFQLWYPVNAHFQGVWLFLLGRSERIFFLVQWCSYVIILVLTYEMGVFLGFRRTAALFCSLLCLGIPVALLQTYSFQGDLSVAALILAGIYFLYICRYEEDPKLLFAAILSFALALGTKQTAYFAMPVIVIFAILWQRRTRLNVKTWVMVVATIAMIGLFSVNKNIQNILETGRFFGKLEAYSISENPIGKATQSFSHNLPRYLYSLFSFDGLPLDAQEKLTAWKAGAITNLDTGLNLGLEDGRYLPPGYDESEAFTYAAVPPLTEDTAWPGVICFLVIPIGVVVSLFNRDRKIRDYAVFALVFGLVYTILVILQRPGWDPYQGRYFVLGLIPAVPLAAAIVPKKKPWNSLVISLLSLVVLIIGLNTLLFNKSKPVLSKYELSQGLTGVLARLPQTNPITLKARSLAGFVIGFVKEIAPVGESVFMQSRIQQIYNSNQSTIENLEFVEQRLKTNEPISLFNPPFLLEYGLFGENAFRQLIPINTLADYGGETYLITTTKIDDPGSMGLKLRGKFRGIFFYRKL